MRFRTLKTKILLLVFTVLVTAAVFLVTLSTGEIERSLYHREQEASKNVLYLVLQTIQNQYDGLLYHNRTVLETRKSAMKDLCGIVIANIEGFHQRFSKGLISEPEAKRQALEQVKTLRYQQDDYFFVYDQDFTAISHPDPHFMGKRLKNYRDAKGLLIVQELMKAAQQPGGGFVTYWWKRLKEQEPVRKIGYGIFYPKWKWMIGTGLYLDDLDSEYQKALNQIIAELKRTFAKIKVEKGGSLFMFNGRKELVIPPADSENTRAQLDDFVRTAGNSAVPLRYQSQSEAGRGSKEVWKEAYVAYFQPLDWYIVASFDEADLKRPGEVLMRKALIFTFVALMVGLAFAYSIGKRIARPISELTGYAKSLASRDFKPEPGSLLERLSQREDEVGSLAGAFSFMQKTLQEYLHHLQQTTAVKERIESELQIAHEIQMSMVPKIFPPFPDRSEFDIFAALVPAKEVGGDLYDFFFIDEDRLFFAVGDVSGKGVPASLFMAVTKTLLKTIAAKTASPGEILTSLNNEICRDNESCMFVTLFCGVLDIRTGRVDYSNAGHNLPYHLQPGGLRPLENAGGRAIGVMEQSHYFSDGIVLCPGESLLLYTDGVTEAMNSAETLYSTQRLEQFLASNSRCSPRQIIGDLVSDVRNFAGDAPQSDDITVLALLYLGTTEKRDEEVKLINRHSGLGRPRV